MSDVNDLDETKARIESINAENKAAYEARLQESNEDTQKFYETVTQREWLLICRALDASREEIGSDQGLTLLGKAFLTGKREHGGASWDRLLDMTDAELLAENGFPESPEPVTTLPPENVVPAETVETPTTVVAVPLGDQNQQTYDA